MELTEIHPGILIVYYLILALSAFLFSNPYYMITFIVLMLFLIYLQGVRSELVNVMKIFIPLGALIIIINPLFIYKGAHKIYLWGSYFITLEALVYGFLMAGTFLIVLLALSSYNKTVSYQEMLYILSKKLPVISMVLVMALRFIPLLNSRAVEIEKLFKLENREYLNSEDALESSSEDENLIQEDDDLNNHFEHGEGLESRQLDIKTDSKIINKVASSKRGRKLIEKARNVGNIMGVTVSWSLEEAMFTAKSMKARGYNATQRSSYLSFHLKKADYCFIAFLIIVLAILAVGLTQGYGYINVYPSLDFSFHDLPLNIYYLAFVLLLMPLIYLELKEVWIWRNHS
ncbi:MAG: energy-coupling factor transporter transmembrane component T [Methanobrevibacter sp.]|nr:energy-coupling factor transporter transmembrane component T [Methanobrevibacter sp.]